MRDENRAVARDYVNTILKDHLTAEVGRLREDLEMALFKLEEIIDKERRVGRKVDALECLIKAYEKQLAAL
jgi:hypothetical protein